MDLLCVMEHSGVGVEGVDVIKTA